MQRIVSITSQGQLTIPSKIREAFNIKGQTKAVIEKQGDAIVVKPTNDFWSLSGSFKSEVSLTDKELRKARDSFSKNWSKNE